LNYLICVFYAFQYALSIGAAAIALILCGGDKSSQANDIRQAIEMAEEWRG
jgi:putative component of toxin-antitoxin plasmid stabilization module